MENGTNNFWVFGYDKDILSYSFLLNVNVDKDIKKQITQGNFLPDQIQNIFGEVNFNRGHLKAFFIFLFYLLCTKSKYLLSFYILI